ncbi:MAG: rhamnose utilization protein RhaD (predicted bifunctional aldolase and dehydrogenase) [Janthinobacterium sp.]|jgi:rhamnose utilization protein RhaD (predicted bifunctional aldolase and dehydrogenase)
MNDLNDIRACVNAYCARLGADRLLVQGAGGNVSWKENGALWVKASGTWLAQAQERDIFVGVDLAALDGALERGDFAASPRLLGDGALKPSIETLLHALMPQRIVLHLHAIDMLALLVQSDCAAQLAARLARLPALRWALVDYHQPGAALAGAVASALARQPELDVLFLKNHGVVIGGADVGALDCTLHTLWAALRTAPRVASHAQRILPVAPIASYFLLDDDVQPLALDATWHARLTSDWALYPDHVVFLGPSAPVHASWDALLLHQRLAPNSAGVLPELVIIEGAGVFAQPGFGAAKLAQLRCYCDVLARLPADVPACPLSMDRIGALLDWDAERYRQALNR